MDLQPGTDTVFHRPGGRKGPRQLQQVPVLASAKLSASHCELHPIGRTGASGHFGPTGSRSSKGIPNPAYPAWP